MSATQWQPIQDHPRPDFARPWISLNGTWRFDFDPIDIGLRQRWFEGHQYERTINVPFCWQSELSGIGEISYNGPAWYERDVLVPMDAGPRLILRFGAVDWSATVWINGEEARTHDGGYSPFSIDITQWAQHGKELRITVRAEDYTKRDLPTGKQIDWYTSVGGIWQTVYLESRGYSEILRAHVYPNIGKEEALFKVQLTTAMPGAHDLHIRARCGDAEHIARHRFDLPEGAHDLEVSLPVPNPALWSPGTPNLYEARIDLFEKEHVVDTVNVYFGMREVGRAQVDGNDFESILLNGKPIYIRGVLHQGYNPAGLYTYPDDEYIRRDLIIARKLGFNAIRLHIKMEDPRVLYWADKLGVLLFCDVPNWWSTSHHSCPSWEATMVDQIARDFNHPSILSWVLFNETWGIGDMGFTPAMQEWVREMYWKAKELDPTRLVEDNSPCCNDHVITDINSWHFYIEHYRVARKHLQEVMDRTQPGSPFNYVVGCEQTRAPLMNSEFGGIGAGSGDRDTSWVFLFLTGLLRKYNKCVGYMYTELFDVEWEHNGILNYDRSEKVFGYPDDISMADLQGEDLPIFDCAPFRTVTAGDHVSFPMLLSHWSRSRTVTLRLRVIGRSVDGRDWSDWIPPVERQLEVPRCSATVIEPFGFQVPLSQGLVFVLAKCFDGDRPVGANYCVVRVMGGPLWTEPRQLALTFPVEAFAQCSSNKESNIIFPWRDKVYRSGAGWFLYRLRLPVGLEADDIEGATLHVEMSAKAAKRRTLWPTHLEHLDYPQSDSHQWPSSATVTIDGVHLADVHLENDPADARGVLSHVAHYHEGSHGVEFKLVFGNDALSALKNKAATKEPFELRFESPSANGEAGGIALYGNSMGSWPSDPALVLQLVPGRAFPHGNLEVVDPVVTEITSIIACGPNGHEWMYTTDYPGLEWNRRGYLQPAWNRGHSAFGTANGAHVRLGTVIKTGHIWMRTYVSIPNEFPKSIVWLELHHDEDIEIYVNGRVLLKRCGFSPAYERIQLCNNQRALFKSGEQNQIAVHCYQRGGGLSVDLGISFALPD